MVGILAVWNDRDPEIAEEYEAWYRHEHLPERVGCPGFRWGRRFAAIEADRAFFTFYEVDDPAVLVSATYRARVAAPTPATRRIMVHWRGMVRSVCDVAWREGLLDGGYLISARWMDRSVAPPPRERVIAALGSAPGLCRLSMWSDVGAISSMDSAEASIRPDGDRAIAHALIAEFSRESDLKEAAAAIATLTVPPPVVGSYRFMCALEKRELAPS